jgi:hypothetical protein
MRRGLPVRPWVLPRGFSTTAEERWKKSAYHNPGRRQLRYAVMARWVRVR